MSSEGTENTASSAVTPPEPTAGHRYGHGAAPSQRGEPADAGCCQNCGRDLRGDPAVDDDVLRVLGDNHDRVPVCDRRDCMEEVFPANVRFEDTRTVSHAVQRARAEIGVIVR